jgi:LmbE family N-acetylglucosaminyl deacetylase
VLWIYLSPHFDDIALSCGGVAWEQSHAGDRIAIWTICAGVPPDTPLSPFAQQLHLRWQTGAAAVTDRRQEDQLAAQILGAAYRYFDWPDCIYRFRPENGQPLIGGEYDLFHASPEETVVQDLADLLKKTAPEGAVLVCPMALGDHVDHLLTRVAAERSGMPIYYYPDYPYLLQLPAVLEKMEQSYFQKTTKKGNDTAHPTTRDEQIPPTKQWARLPTVVSEEALNAWQNSIAAYRSQISTFWNGIPAMEMAIRNYWAGGGGRLWQFK